MSLDTNALMRAARCFDCLPSSTQEEIVTYIIAFATGLGSDPDHLAQLAKCMKCLSPATLREVRSYLLARLAGGSTDPNVLAEEAKCYVCIPDGMLGAVETYLFSTDPAGPGISDPNALAFAARFFQKLNSPTLLEIQVYALATAAGTGTDPNTLASLAKCFTCLPLPFLRNAGVFLAASVEPIGGGSGVSGCTDVPATLIPVITGNYNASGSIISLNVTFPKVCCTPLGWIAVQGNQPDLSDGTSIGGGLDTVGHAGETNFSVTVNITGGFFTPITQTYVGVIQQCAGGVNSAVSNAVNALSGAPLASAWADRVVTNGGVRPSNATISAAATFLTTLLNSTVYAKVRALNIIAPDNLTAARTPLIVGEGSDPWANNLFVAGDLTVNGLLGDGATKFLNTGVQNNPNNANQGKRGLAVYTSTINGAGLRCLMGATAGVVFDDIIMLYANSASVQHWNPTASQITSATANWAGYYSGQRTASNAAALYLANSVTPHFAAGTDLNARVTVVDTTTIYTHARHSDAVVDLWVPYRLSFAAATLGLTSAEDLILFNAVQALRTTLGGGFV